MKKKLIAFYENQIKAKRKALNKLSEQDQAVAEAAIDAMEALVEELKATDEEKTTEDVKAELLKAIEEKFKALEEKPADPNQPSENYLKSQNAAHDFCHCARISRNGEEFRANWEGKLSTNGITFTTSNDPNYLPEVVKGKIQDAWERVGWLSKLKNTGAKQYAVRYNSSTQTDANSRAKGHIPTESKTSMTENFVSKKVAPQMVYSLMDIDNITIFMDDNSLLDYVATTLVDQWIYEVGRAVLVGDGRNTGSTGKITSIESIVRASTDAFVTVNTHSSSNQLIDELVALVDAIEVEDGVNDITLFMSKSDISSLRKYMASSTSTSVYVPIADIAEAIGVAEIVPTKILGSDYKAIAMRPSKYVIVGEPAPAFKADEDLKSNVTTWRYENPCGGAVEGLKSAAVLKAN